MTKIRQRQCTVQPNILYPFLCCQGFVFFDISNIGITDLYTLLKQIAGVLQRVGNIKIKISFQILVAAAVSSRSSTLQKLTGVCNWLVFGGTRVLAKEIIPPSRQHRSLRSAATQKRQQQAATTLRLFCRNFKIYLYQRTFLLCRFSFFLSFKHIEIGLSNQVIKSMIKLNIHIQEKA